MDNDYSLIKTRSNIKPEDFKNIENILLGENDYFKPFNSNILLKNYENECFMERYILSLNESKYFKTYSKNSIKLMDIACRVHDGMNYPLERIDEIVKSMENKKLTENENNFLRNCKNYIKTHEKNRFFEFGEGTCKDSTDKMGELIDEEFNQKNKEIYWISIVFPTNYSKHATLLAFNQEGNWMALDGKTIIEEYNPYDSLIISPKILRKKFPKNVF